MRQVGGGTEGDGRMVRWCVEGEDLKIHAVKSKVMVLNREEGLEYEIHVDGICLEHVSEFKNLGCVLDKSGTYGAECSRKVASRKGGCRCHLDLQLQCA